MSARPLDPFDPFAGGRRIFVRWCADMSEFMDDYLRSPLFLGWMRIGLRAASEAQMLQAKLFADLTSSPAREAEKAPDPLRS